MIFILWESMHYHAFDMNMIIHNPVMANDQRTEVNGEQSLWIKSLE